MENKNFLKHIDQIAQEYEITREQVINSLEKALISGCKKTFQIKKCRVFFDPNYDKITLYKQYIVVDEECDVSVLKEQDYIHLKKAKEINSSVEVGEILEIEVDPKKDFNFYGSRDFKNKFNEELLKFQRENIFNFFKQYENKLMMAEVIEEKLNFFILMLEKNFKTFIFKKDLMLNDHFNIGEKIFVLITEVRNSTPKHLKIYVSRINNQFVVELLKYFIPEIRDGLVQIMAIARIPSSRVKVGLSSNNKKIDPIGTCIGEKGYRIKNILNILRGEKIDLFKWSVDIEKLIINALKPAQIIQILNLDFEKKIALVSVAADQVALAIGKSGQNLKLAMQVTRWQIEIQANQ
ncbi:MAG: transcription termination factor NusA [Pigeon pea little leaf phytoplasma]|uniref:Transcription termination/antitermination protein NusA n=1 Tax=Candidatus Phytoplasma fabacearum TaxID=2982628 RepID=A0ABU8ZSC9_9MOLU|nr:transcription termination factor NusA ['Bituminaria bituminosa' little leaf phytoplasma]MDV3148780.1 transcription termination factor NusA [Pigeon pea little leaf phytoplasma]MDO7983484.1 transcription termination factor NusA ['Bituminaria bituminosa' little leaf phytoplasma]MDO8023889.1 transcription termination factor NusA ['Bituminaria bituminosa' little leaf phytoplasma]MDO8030500.1 transcription termination factor NusA ['Bituminaria bituminosa' little leaf phytoplasma]MDV3154014.1 tran